MTNSYTNGLQSKIKELKKEIGDLNRAGSKKDNRIHELEAELVECKAEHALKKSELVMMLAQSIIKDIKKVVSGT